MIRDYIDEDRGRVIDIWLSCNYEAHDFIDKEFFLDKIDMMDTILKSKNCKIYVYLKDNVILGFIELMHNYVGGIFVDPKYQRQGIGHKLLDYAKQFEDTLYLNVFKKNEKALNFYKKEGFQLEREAYNDATHEHEFSMIFNK